VTWTLPSYSPTRASLHAHELETLALSFGMAGGRLRSGDGGEGAPSTVCAAGSCAPTFPAGPQQVASLAGA